MTQEEKYKLDVFFWKLDYQMEKQMNQALIVENRNLKIHIKKLERENKKLKKKYKDEKN